MPNPYSPIRPMHMSLHAIAESQQYQQKRADFDAIFEVCVRLRACVQICIFEWSTPYQSPVDPLPPEQAKT